MVSAIGQRIKSARVSQHMTLEELANKVGLTRQTLSRYETGAISGIPLPMIETLANALDTTPAYLMGWKDKEEETDEVWLLREQLRRDPKRRMLFDAAKNVRTEDIETAVRILDALKGNDSHDAD